MPDAQVNGLFGLSLTAFTRSKSCAIFNALSLSSIMGQKYKVFIDEWVVFFSDEKFHDLIDLSSKIVHSKDELLRVMEGKNAFVQTKNPSSTMHHFFKHFVSIEAAGGIVQREDSFLMIFRNKVWDLPKGKREKMDKTKEETAIREVVEECGLETSPTISEKLPSTFHIYENENKSYIKETYWFLMNYEGLDAGMPQKEEGIEKIQWFSQKEFTIKATNSFPSISELVHKFLHP